MSAAAITSALLPQGQGAAEPPAATQGALAVLDAVFGAILKGVDSQDAGSPVATRNFGASETNGDSSLPQPQGSAVKASASSPTATFEASLAALDYEAMAGTDGSSAIATQAKPSQSQTLTQATTSPRRWTPTASPGQTDSRKAWTSRTATTSTNAPPTSTADANSSGASTRLTRTRAAAQIEIGQTVCKRGERRESGRNTRLQTPRHRLSAAARSMGAPRPGRPKLGKAQAKSPRPTAASPTRRPPPRRSSTLLRRLRFRPRSPASATSPASLSQATASCAANNPNQGARAGAWAEVLELAEVRRFRPPM